MTLPVSSRRKDVPKLTGMPGRGHESGIERRNGDVLYCVAKVEPLHRWRVLELRENDPCLPPENLALLVPEHAARGLVHHYHLAGAREHEDRVADLVENGHTGCERMQGRLFVQYL